MFLHYIFSEVFLHGHWDKSYYINKFFCHLNMSLFKSVILDAEFGINKMDFWEMRGSTMSYPNQKRESP